MYFETETQPNLPGEMPPGVPSVTENRIDTLRSLVTLLLREVESLNDPSTRNMFRGEETIDLSKEMARFEIEMIRHAMSRSKGNQTAAAAMLGVKLTTLHAKIKRYGIEKFIGMSRL